MTLEQATAQAAQLNDLIEIYTGTIIYKVVAIWVAQYEKEYTTVLIPTKYVDQYDSADNSEQLAFLRVSIKALLLPYESADTIVSNFDSEAVKDAELNNYLNPEE
jgi:hypothetical protein